ncbi:hypothetical protein ACFOLJ_26225 [Rugamonas sp. CCM 8940]|uniref:hypothetical protein n=1 Tax=Rugamonas sp. CCM 8940 TaxID=2765359 RepID=UPI0018F7B8CB|nr:hypothetical protein [Rugamonas sp. CCM 8940]MBJ7310036.1 hypothetical protein [Rugamonas sp. CCM 8940]
MKQITLALPYALPPAELAADLQRALHTPALAALLSRTSARRVQACDSGARVLPHESWLAAQLGLRAQPSASSAAAETDASAPLAGAVLHGYGQLAQDGHWFIVHPIHVQMARTHLSLADPRALALEDADGRVLFAAAQPYFAELGKELRYGDAGTWFLRADDWAGLATSSPDSASSMNLSDLMPEGPNAIAFRKLQNEIQMLWYEHPVNEARQARGLPPVNSFWIWGGAGAAPPAATHALAVNAGPAWMMALARPALRDVALAQLLDGGDDAPATVVCAALIEPGIAGDWSQWLARMQQLEQDWFAPLLAALQTGRLGSATLILNHRGASAEFSTSKLAQRKFWHKHTLKNLQP